MITIVDKVKTEKAGQRPFDSCDSGGALFNIFLCFSFSTSWTIYLPCYDIPK